MAPLPSTKEALDVERSFRTRFALWRENEKHLPPITENPVLLFFAKPKSDHLRLEGFASFPPQKDSPKEWKFWCPRTPSVGIGRIPTGFAWYIVDRWLKNLGTAAAREPRPIPCAEYGPGEEIYRLSQGAGHNDEHSADAYRKFRALFQVTLLRDLIKGASDQTVIATTELERRPVSLWIRNENAEGNWRAPTKSDEPILEKYFGAIRAKRSQAEAAASRPVEVQLDPTPPEVGDWSWPERIEGFPKTNDLANSVIRELANRTSNRAKVIIVLHGPPGVGKTETAWMIAGALREDLTKWGLPAEVTRDGGPPVRIIFLGRRIRREGLDGKGLESEHERYRSLLVGERIGDDELKILLTEKFGYSQEAAERPAGARLWIVDGWSDDARHLARSAIFGQDPILVTTIVRYDRQVQPNARFSPAIIPYSVQGIPYSQPHKARALLCRETTVAKDAFGDERAPDSEQAAKAAELFNEYATLAGNVPLSLISSSFRLESDSMPGVLNAIRTIIADTRRTALEWKGRSLHKRTGYRYRLYALLATIDGIPSPPVEFDGPSGRSKHIKNDNPRLWNDQSRFIAIFAWLTPPHGRVSVPMECVLSAINSWESATTIKSKRVRPAEAMTDHFIAKNDETVSLLMKYHIISSERTTSAEAPKRVKMLPFLARELIWALSEHPKIISKVGTASSIAPEHPIDISALLAIHCVLPRQYDEAGAWPEYLRAYLHWESDTGVDAAIQVFISICRANWQFHPEIIRIVGRLARRLIAFQCQLAERASMPAERDTAVRRANDFGEQFELFIVSQSSTGNREYLLRQRPEAALTRVFAPLVSYRLLPNILSLQDERRAHLISAYKFAVRAAYPSPQDGYPNDALTEWHYANALRWCLVVRAEMIEEYGDEAGTIRDLLNQMQKHMDRRDELAKKLEFEDRAIEGDESFREKWRDLCVMGYLYSQDAESDKAEGFFNRSVKPLREIMKHAERPLKFDERLFLALGAATLKQRPGKGNDFWRSPSVDREIIELGQAAHFTLLGQIQRIIQDGLVRKSVRRAVSQRSHNRHD